MTVILILLAAIIIVGLAALATVGFEMAIVRDKNAGDEPEIDLSKCGGKPWGQYRKCLDESREWAKSLPYRDVSIKSRDGLTLHGRFIKAENPVRTVIFFHGYRSRGLYDFSWSMRFYLENGCNLLIVDHRAHGESEGKYIGYGVLERRDAALWAEFADSMPERTDSIFLAGISMGASTVMMTASLPLPASVKGIIADCGFTSPKEIISDVTRQKGIAVFPTVPLISLASRLFAGYSLGEYSTLDALKNTKLPILLIHGEDDIFVPCEMSKRNYAACESPDKKLITVPEAGHAQSYLVSPELYEAEVLDFFAKHTF